MSGSTNDKNDGAGDGAALAVRTWNMWAYRYEDGTLWHVGARRWVELHGISCPVVPVLVEELSCERANPSVTHYAWEYLNDRHFASGEPHMIFPRAGDKTTMLLDMCFAYGFDVEIKRGRGRVMSLRITETTEVAAAEVAATEAEAIKTATT